MKFSEGGQPVFLDDLQLLQENGVGMWRSILGVLSGNRKAFLLRDCEQRTLSTDSSTLSKTVSVGSGVLVTDGGLCPFEGTTLTVARGGEIYVCLKRGEGGRRTFGDGQVRGCVSTLTATLETTSAGADAAYSLDDLKTLLELLSEALSSSGRKERVKITFANGYTGSLQVKLRTDGDWDISVDVASPNTDWSTDLAFGFMGFLFAINDDTYNAMFLKASPRFRYDGADYWLIFTSEGICYVLPYGDTVMYPEKTFPIMPISLSFKLSEMSNL